MATEQHLFDPVLSLEGTCSGKDGAPDPGCAGEPPAYPAGEAPSALEAPCGTATDPHGDIYVANPSPANVGWGTGGKVDVFNPQGVYLTEIPLSEKGPCNLAVDSKGNVYVRQLGLSSVALYKPSAYPPSHATSYSLAKVFESPTSGPCKEEGTRSVAVDPSSDHLYIGRGKCVEEYGSAAEASSLVDGEATIPPAGFDFYATDVYGKNGDIYATARNRHGGNPSIPVDYRVMVIAGSDGHLMCEIDGTETPQGKFEFSIGGVLAVDQANGDVYIFNPISGGAASVDQFAVKGEECKYVGMLPTPPTVRPLFEELGDIAVDDPIVKGEAGYDSPNEGYVYVTTGAKASSSHLYAYEPVVEPVVEFKLTVTTTGSGSGTVTSSPAGINCGLTCSALYEEATEVTLTATPASGSTFSGWSGSGCSGTASCKVTMSEAKSAAAEFTEEESGPVFHKLTVTVIGNGEVSANTGTISGCTSAGGSACEGTYVQGAHVTLTETPGEGSLFNGWQTLQCDESTATTCEVTIGSGDEGMAASFVTAQALKVSTEGPGTITSSPGLISCTPFCEDSFPQGTKVTLTATPSPGAILIAWKHCDSGGVAGLHCTVAMDKAKAVTAVFAQGHALTVKSSGLAKVQSSPAGISCLYGCQSTTAAYNATTKVTLKATPARHFHFAGWESDCSGTGPCEVSMGADREVKALFTRNTAYSLTLARTGAGKGIVKSHPGGINCGFTCISVTASYDEGEEVLLEVSKVALGSTFGGWSGGGCSGTATTCTVVIDEAKEVQAEFK
jgi:hypothetical protein